MFSVVYKRNQWERLLPNWAEMNPKSSSFAVVPELFRSYNMYWESGDSINTKLSFLFAVILLLLQSPVVSEKKKKENPCLLKIIANCL